MGFSKRRGRPRKIEKATIDRGTNELNAKRKFNITSEPLDICLANCIITQEQHNAGIRLRWLYTLKFGAPTISSYQPDDFGGGICKQSDDKWIAKRQIEYLNIIQCLKKNHQQKIVMDICVFGRMSQFIYDLSAKINLTKICLNKEYILFNDGLNNIIAVSKL